MSKARILHSIQRLDLQTTTELLEARPSLISVTDRQGRNLLHLACSASWSKLSVPPGGGLFAAGWWDDVAILDLLIRAGARIDIVVGVTPFRAAWCWKRFEAAKFLALKGADVNYQDAKGRTALHHGVEKEFDPSLLKWLVKHGASPDITDRDGVSSRVRASRKRNKRFLTALT